MALGSLFRNRGYLLLTAITLVSCFFFFAILSPFILTITLSGIFAVGLTPLVEKIRSKYGIGRQRIFIAIVILGLFVFFSLASICIFRIYDLSLGEDRDKSAEVLKNIKDSIGSISGFAEAMIADVLKNLGVKSPPQIGRQTDLFMKRFGEWTFQSAGKFFAALPEFIIHFIVFILMLFVFFRYRNRIYNLLIRYKIASQTEMDTVTTLLQASGGSMLSTNLIVGSIQAAVVTIGALIVGLNEWSIIFTLTFICSFIPVIGAAPIGFLLAGFCFLTGGKGSGIFMIFVAITSGTVDNVIRPYLVARADENLNALISLVGIIGAIMVFGFHGIFLGPFVMTVASSALPKLLEVTDRP
jgi:predicted PurR-regulated permease PerM